MATETPAAGGSPQLTAEHIAARVLLEASTFDEAAPRILEAICGAFGWEHGAFWALHADSGTLRCDDIWTAPSAQFPEFDAASRALTIARGMGLPGRVWELGEPVWIPDVTKDA